MAVPASFIAVTAVSMMSAFNPMNTAANPTKECSAATSCGISVICTLPAIYWPA